jgi:hypothetical protein
MSAENKRPSRTGTIILGLLVLVMASGFAFFAYKYYAETKVTESQADNIEEMSAEIDDLETDLENYQLELENANLDIEEKERLLAEKEAQLVDKQKRIDQLLRDKKISAQQAADLSKKVETLEYYITKYQKEIEELKAQVVTLQAENQEKEAQIDTISGRLSQTQDIVRDQGQQLAVASVIKVSNFKFFRVKDSGKEVNVTDEPLRKGAIEQLKVCFDMIENNVAAVGERELYIAFVDPKGATVKDMGGQSGYFTYEGKEMVYTLKTKVNYDRSTQKVCVTFKQPKGYEYEKGVHKVYVYEGNYQLGNSSFDVK